MKSPPSKKAQISPIFKYIFVLIIGAIILIFFIRFAIQAEKGGKEVIKAEVIQMLDASLQAFSISESSSTLIPSNPWPQIVNLKFGTKANCGKFTITGQKFFMPIERVLFGPSEMKDKQLQAWTQSWKFPFRVTNIFYLTNSKSKYYLMYDTSNQDFVRRISSTPPSATAFEMDHFPRIFDVKYTNTEPLKPKTLDMVKVNYFEPISGVGQDLKGSYIKVSDACKEEDKESYECYGTVTFYEEDVETSTFIGRELMFGAIMADSYEEYDCQYKRALNELERITHLYLTKTEKLKSKKLDCKDDAGNTKYQQMINLLNNMATHIETLSQTYDDAGILSSDANSIKTYNEELAGDENCEMVF